MLATQSRGRARQDWWLRLVATLKSGSTLQSLTALIAGEAEFYAVVKGSKVGLALESIFQDLEIPMKGDMQGDSSTANERNTLTRGSFGYENEFKMETSVSRRCLQRTTAQMLERSQSLLQYYNNIATLQGWCSIDHGSHTPLQDDGSSRRRAGDGAGDGAAAPKQTFFQLES